MPFFIFFIWLHKRLGIVDISFYLCLLWSFSEILIFFGQSHGNDYFFNSAQIDIE